MSPQFVWGFAELAAMIPDVVGEPLEDEHFNPESGDTLQQTSTGLMVWHKETNICAFTNGDRTWINGPYGLQERGNNERFDWEQPPIPSPLIERWDSPNCWRGRPFGPPIAIVLHTEGGSESGAEAWLSNPNSQVSAHFGVNLEEGSDVDQWVDISDRAWHAGILESGNRWFEVYDGPRDGFTENPNNWSMGIETEDHGNPNQEVTEWQYQQTLAICRQCIEQYPSIRWLLKHADISPRSRANCPGPRWIDSGRFAQLASECGLSVLE